MRTKRERVLDSSGYHFTGQYASGREGKEAMKAAAAEWRKKGFFATVVHRVYQGRVISTDGYSVYTKPKT